MNGCNEIYCPMQINHYYVVSITLHQALAHVIIIGTIHRIDLIRFLYYILYYLSFFLVSLLFIYDGFIYDGICDKLILL